MASPNHRQSLSTPPTTDVIEMVKAAASRAVREMKKAEATPTAQLSTAAKEALDTARREGLELELKSGTASGFAGVSRVSGHGQGKKPWRATIRLDGKQKTVGTFATKEEAALTYARHSRASKAPQRKATTSATPAPCTRPPAERPLAARAAATPPAAAPAHAETAHLARVCSQLRREELRGMAGVRALLNALGLPQYAESFDEQGYDDAEYLLSLPAAKLDWVGQQTGMSSAHARKMTDLLSSCRVV